MPRQQRYQEFDPNSAPPPAPPDDDDRSGPIGVPEDYPIPGGTYGPGNRPLNPAFTGDRPPPTDRYMQGDEFLPANWGSFQILALQQQLEKAGLLDQNYPRGVWDPRTMAAYYDLLAMANAQGVDWQQALAQAVMAGETFGQAAPERAPLVVQTTDPATLRQVFRRSIIELTGQGWSQDQINSMVDSYHQIERQRQQEAYDLQLTGGEVEAIPDPAAFIEDRLRTEHPEEVASEEGLGFISDFINMAQGGGF